MSKETLSVDGSSSGFANHESTTAQLSLLMGMAAEEDAAGNAEDVEQERALERWNLTWPDNSLISGIQKLACPVFMTEYNRNQLHTEILAKL